MSSRGTLLPPPRLLCFLPVCPSTEKKNQVGAKAHVTAALPQVLLPLPLPLRGGGSGALRSPALGAEDVSRAPPLGDEMVDVAHVVLRVAHVVEPGTAGALGPAPDDLDAQDVGAVDLVPHLDADLGQVVPEQDGGVDAGALDRQAHAGERLAAPRHHLQHVARLRRVPVLLGEEKRAQTLGVQTSDLLRVVGFENFWGEGSGGGHARVDGEGGAGWCCGVLRFEVVCGVSARWLKGADWARGRTQIWFARPRWFCRCRWCRWWRRRRRRLDGGRGRWRRLGCHCARTWHWHLAVLASTPQCTLPGAEWPPRGGLREHGVVVVVATMDGTKSCRRCCWSYRGPGPESIGWRNVVALCSAPAALGC